MAVMSWESTIRPDKEVEKESSWEKSIQPDVSEVPVEEPSMLESFARGAEQGLTFGFGDEINAALEAATSDKTYDQAVQESRQAFDAASAANPITSIVGNIAGGIAPASMLSKLVGGGAALARSGVIGQNASKLDKIAKAIQYGSKGQGSIHGLAAAGAVEGALGGAALGAGETEKVSEIPEGMVEGASIGGKVGAVGGGIYGLGRNVLGSIVKSPFAQDIMKTVKLSDKYNVDPMYAVQGEQIKNRSTEVAQDAIQSFKDVWTDLNQKKWDSLADVKKPFSLQNEEMKKFNELMPSADVADLEKYVADREEEVLKIASEIKMKDEALMQHPFYEVIKTNPYLKKLVEGYQKTKRTYDNSARTVKVLEDAAQERADLLQKALVDIVDSNANRTGVIPKEHIYDSINNLTEKINANKILSDADYADAYASFTKLISNKDDAASIAQLQSIIKQFPDLPLHAADLRELKYTKNIFTDLQKSATDKGKVSAITKKIKDELKLLKDAKTTKETIKHSEVAGKKLQQQSALVDKAMNKIGISPEDMDLIKKDVNLIDDIKELDDLVQQDLYASNKASSANSSLNRALRQPKTQSGMSISDTDHRVLTNLNDKVKELSKKYDFNAINNDQAKQLWTDLKEIERQVFNKKTAYDMKETSPFASEAFLNLQNNIKSVFGEANAEQGKATFKQFASDESQVGKALENLIGDAIPDIDSPTTINKLHTSLKEKHLLGETSGKQLALQAIDQIKDPAAKKKMLEILDKIQDYSDVLKMISSGSSRQGYLNPISEFHTKGTAGKVASVTKGARQTVKSIKPETINAIRSKSETLANIAEKITDTSLPETKRRAYMNVLMNNPLTRRAIQEQAENESVED